MTSAFNGADRATQALLRENGLGPMVGNARPEHDAGHWSPRWMRVAIVEHDAVIMFDRSLAVDIKGCGQCPAVQKEPGAKARYLVTRFCAMPRCANCGRFWGHAQRSISSYRGDSEADALAAFYAAELELLGRDAD